MRDYGRVYAKFWSSPNIQLLSDDGKLLALYLMTCQHSTISGVFRLPDGYVAEDIKWSTERVSKGFAELFDNGFANRCETTKWVWVVKHFEWNAPENPNQVKAAKKCAEQIPDECGWKSEFMRVWGEYLGFPKPPIIEPLPNPSETLSKPEAVAVAVIETVSESVTESLVDPKPIDRKPKRNYRLPENFELTDDRAQAALLYWKKQTRPDLRPLDEFEKFIAHHRSKGSTMADWDCAWQTWYCNAIKFNPPSRVHAAFAGPKTIEQTRDEISQRTERIAAALKANGGPL